jgi:hypothetical protein
MTTTRVFTFSGKNFRSAEVFNEVPEARQEVVEQNNMLMLRELAGKLIQVVQEAMKDGDIGEDIRETTRYEISAEAKRVFFDAMKEQTVSEYDRIQGKKSLTCDVEIAKML